MIDKLVLYTLCAIIYVGTALDYADALDINLNSKCDSLDMLIVLLWPMISFGRFIKLINNGFMFLLEKVNNRPSHHNKNKTR